MEVLGRAILYRYDKTRRHWSEGDDQSELDLASSRLRLAVHLLQQICTKKVLVFGGLHGNQRTPQLYRCCHDSFYCIGDKPGLLSISTDEHWSVRRFVFTIAARCMRSADRRSIKPGNASLYTRVATVWRQRVSRQVSSPRSSRPQRVSRVLGRNTASGD